MIYVSDTTELACATAPHRGSKHWQQGRVTWGTLKEWAASPGTVKEAGNYLLGTLRGTLRRKTTVVSRSAVVLDVDHAPSDWLEDFRLVFPAAALVHTTWSSAPDGPRYRVIIPLLREVLPDEYESLARALISSYGEDIIDPCSATPAQYMFRPAAEHREWYRWEEIPGTLLDPDPLLVSFQDDLSTAPIPRKAGQNKRDPFALEGIIGAFNRAYGDDWQLLIDTYDLPYEPDGDRWRLVGARSMSGMGPMGPGLVFSHHTHDPASGAACSAFDLVRLHHFGELDEGQSRQTPLNRLPSFSAMQDLASSDERARAELIGADFSDDPDIEDWRLRLALRPKTGEILDTADNWTLIRDNDPAFDAIWWDDLVGGLVVLDDLPWRELDTLRGEWTDADVSSLRIHIEKTYKIRPSAERLDDLLKDWRTHHHISPVRDYLSSLEWDGTPRVETCLPGVTPTPFTRMAVRKALVAAVARAMEPGIKWDHVLMLQGPEAIGKTAWIEKMSRGWMTNLGRVGDKDTLLAMHRSWIVVSDEGHSLYRSDADALKEFLTRTTDIYRAPYDRIPQSHPRGFVVWGTTNDEVFLPDQEGAGNRRFWVVKCETPVNFEELTDEYIDQVWAEAVAAYRSGAERLWLDADENRTAAEARSDFTEDDTIYGQIVEYLSTPKPPEWDEMTIDQRQMYLSDFVPGDKGELLTVTCTRQLWFEALGMRQEPNRWQLKDIRRSLSKIPGWYPEPGQPLRRVKGYGPQRRFIRLDSDLL